MDQKDNKLKIPSELSLAAFLSAGLTIVISVLYSVLCILALVYRFQCDMGLASDATGDKYFLFMLYRVYIQADTCDNALSTPPTGVSLMTSDTVFIFVVTTLVASLLSCAAAIVLIVVVAENKCGLVFPITWSYICICVSSLVVDITFAAFFGADYAEMVYTMEDTFPGILSNYVNDVLRLGSLLFMTISLKGYCAPLINIILLGLLAIYATKYRNKLQTDDHSIHKVGAINAFEPQVNRGFFAPDEPRRSPRSPARAPPLTPLSDFTNSRDYDRSNSWQHSPAPMPLSFIEEPRRARPNPASEPQWRRDPWPPAPPLPAPDYSPPARRLKSALKPNYM